MKTISFIIPVYNEEKRLDKTFKALKKLKLPRGLELSEIIFVNDGSTDVSTLRIKEEIFKGRYAVSLVSYKNNKGKGYAIRKGLTEITADYAVFFDADMSTPLTQLKKLAVHMENGVDVIVGTRRNGHSTVIKHQPLLREILGNGFTLLTKATLGVHGTDFTCGFKALSQSAQTLYKTHGRINRWGYDAELIFLAQKYNLSVTEVPVVWSNDSQTKVKLGFDVVNTLIELLSIRLHSIRGGYTPVVATKPVAIA